MGIHELGYRRYSGKLQTRPYRIWAIFSEEFVFRIKNKWIIVILVLSWIFGLFPTVLTMDPFVYLFTLFFWLVFFAAIAGATIIANDLRNNSIVLFLSRPIDKIDYFIGKFLTIFTLIALVAILPALIVSLMIFGLYYNVDIPIYDKNSLIATYIGISVLITFVFSAICMAFSSITDNYKFAGGGIFSTILFSNIIALILSGLNEKIQYLSIWFNFMVIVDDWTDANFMEDYDWPVSFAIVFGIALVCLGISWFRIWKTELSK